MPIILIIMYLNKYISFWMAYSSYKLVLLISPNIFQPRLSGKEQINTYIMQQDEIMDILYS